jgi:hypothetical protein
MNLFRSEEHVHNWSGFKADTEGGIVSLLDMAKAFSGSFFKRRLDPDYVSHTQEYMMEMVGTWQAMGSFWQL